METKNIVKSTIDYAKFIFAILVVGIHTEPFGFNFWLDKIFGIITRLCVPFFFVCSSYFFFLKEKNSFIFLRRLTILLFIWSFIYLPFDLGLLREKNIWEIVQFYFWNGPNHALWYLSGSLLGFIIIRFLLKVLGLKKELVFLLSIVILLVGCAITTYSPLIERAFSVSVYNTSNCRNGLFYAFPYMAMGMIIANYYGVKKPLDNNLETLEGSKKDCSEVATNCYRLHGGGYFIGFLISSLTLCVESYYLVVILKTHYSILWVSVLPMTYFFFMWLLQLKICNSKELSLYLRKMSTLIFVSHGLFILLFSKFFNHFILFLTVTISSMIFSHIIIGLSRKRITFLKYLF